MESISPETSVLSLLERIAAAAERKDTLPRNEVYEQLLLSKDKEIGELETKLTGSRQASYDMGYEAGLKIGATRIKNAAYKLRRQGNEAMCVAMLSSAKIMDKQEPEL